MSDKYLPAFPSKKRVYRAGYATQEFEPVDGMTLRDYYATEAMAAFIVAISDGSGIHPQNDERIAERAFEMADAMLKARKS